MKKGLLLLYIGLSLLTAKGQWVSIPDTNFGTWLNGNGYSACMQGNNSLGWQMDTSCQAIVNETWVTCSVANISDLTGITYFDNLSILWCYENSLTYLPPLPNNLIDLDYSNNHISSPPILPSTLENLNCSHNQITSLPTLPSTLTWLLCTYNQLTSLPPLPNLYHLECEGNLITTLPILPDSLYHLGCSFNPISNLPLLPDRLMNLYCSNCQLTNLPTLPNSLRRFYCNNNQLSTLGAFPDSLVDCRINNNPIICLPLLKRIVSFDFRNTLVTCLPNYGNVTNSTPDIHSLPLCNSLSPNPCANINSTRNPKLETQNFFLSPNPATTHLTIQLQQTPSSSTAFQLFDITGRMILQKPLSDKTNSIDVSGVSRGMYLYSVVSEGEKAGAGKVIIE